jgi:SecD/SecF fusion protein
MRTLQQPADKRTEIFKKLVQDDPNRLDTLQKLATVYDERQAVQQKRDALNAQSKGIEKKISEAGLKLDSIQQSMKDWAKLDDENLKAALKKFLGSENQIGLLTDYVKTHKELTGTLSQLTDESGINDRYETAKRGLDRLNLTQDQVNLVLEMSQKSAKRADRVAQLKAEFPDRQAQIDAVVAAYDAYSQYQGRLDDPSDLRRMLKGAGILEFRILPTQDRTEISAAEIERYLQALTEKGPKYSSDASYVWVQIESMPDWHSPSSIVGKFGEKYYVLASNKTDEKMLHDATNRDWRLDNSYPTNDEMGRRAIGFHLDIKGGNLFYNITKKNGSRPLAILLDDVAISAPEINPEHPIGQSGIIMGTFTQTEVSDMVNKLNAGSLPARMIDQPISERVIGPSIGADNLAKGIKAGLIGVIGVVTLMAGYYLVGGMIADAAMLLNVLFTLAMMVLLRATFTLSGIAGTILTIGMSVDANVLIFEAIREQQEQGKSLFLAIREGYKGAFTTIFDSNVTTITAAAILYYVGTEDLKGFAIVLMLGLASSMFTAVFVTRVVLDFLVSKRILKDRLLMLHLIRVPKIDWMAKRKYFFTLSGILVIGGLTLFLARDKSKYGIEFTGGTSVQINLKPEVSLTRQEVEDRMVKMAKDLKNSDMEAVTVYSVGNVIGQAPKGEKIYDQYEISTPAANRLLTTVAFGQGGSQTADTVRAAIQKTASQQRREFGGFEVNTGADRAFEIVTSPVNPTMVQNVLKTSFPDAQVSESKVDEVVPNAIRKAFEGQLEIQQNLQPTIASAEKITNAMIETYPELADYIGGIKMNVALGRPATPQEVDQRLKDLRFRPDTQNLAWYPYQLLDAGMRPLLGTTQPVTTFTYVSSQPEAGLRTLTDEEWSQFVNNEKTRVVQAAQRETSLPRVTQIDPFVGAEAKTKALIAIVLSLVAMFIYIAVRWQLDWRYGFGGVITLFHDTCASVGLVSACTFIAATPIGQALLISGFKIDLVMIAAFLTLLGYSINDTIVVYDRIRTVIKRRGGIREISITPEIINDSINLTMSRTLLTGTTTLLVVAVLYIFGGPGLRGFNFCILTGIVIGTYSSIAISAPVLLMFSRVKGK